MTTWTLRLNYTKPPLSLNDRMHWRVKAKIVADLKATVTALVTDAGIPHCDAVSVQLVYVPRDSRTRDRDNLVATLKPCIDALKGLVVVDDSPEYVSWSAPLIAPADKNDPHLRLEITRKDV